MDDFIYILLGLFWIGLAIYRNAQKKKMKQMPKDAQPQEEESDTVEEPRVASILEDLLMGQRTTSIIDEFEEDSDYVEYSSEKTIPGYKAVESFEDEYDKMGYDSVEEIDTETIDQKIAFLMKNEKVMEVHDLDEGENAPLDFDLKKAVIYSEILNRRYF